MIIGRSPDAARSNQRAESRQAPRWRRGSTAGDRRAGGGPQADHDRMRPKRPTSRSREFALLLPRPSTQDGSSSIHPGAITRTGRQDKRTASRVRSRAIRSRPSMVRANHRASESNRVSKSMERPCPNRCSLRRTLSRPPVCYAEHGWLAAVVPAAARRFRVVDARIAATLESAGAELTEDGAEVEIAPARVLQGKAPTAIVSIGAPMLEGRHRPLRAARRVVGSLELVAGAARARRALRALGVFAPGDRDLGLLTTARPPERGRTSNEPGWAVTAKRTRRREPRRRYVVALRSGRRRSEGRDHR